VRKALGFFLFILLFISAFTSGCGTVQGTGGENDKPLVYTSIYPLTYFTQQIGGDRIELVSIIPAGAQPHSFEPSSKTVASISKARLFIYNGAGMEHYISELAPILQSSGVKLVDTSENVQLLRIEEAEEHSEEETSHEHGEYDPHIWLSPARATQQSQAICQALAEIDPENAAYYQDNLDRFLQELQRLDQDFRSALAPHRGKKLVVSHAAFRYLAEDYGLEQLPLMGVNAEAEPASGTLGKTINLIREHSLPYVFWDPLDSPKLVETLRADTGVAVLPLNSLGTLTAKELQEGKDNLSVMRDNLASLQKGLEGQP